MEQHLSVLLKRYLYTILSVFFEQMFNKVSKILLHLVLKLTALKNQLRLKAYFP